MKTIKIFALILALVFLYACSSSDSTPGPAPAVTATFVSSGGTGGTGTGGAGGDVYIDVYGDVQVNKSGSVDTSFAVPTYASNYGANKLTITANTVVKLDPSPVAGDVYQRTGDQNLYYFDTSEHVASGLEVQAGATLTLPANWYGSYSYISLTKTVTINGTVKPTNEGYALHLYSYSLLQIGTTGTVTTKPATAGGNGGYIYLYSEGVAINQGTIDSSGSDGTTEAGGGAGGVEINADTFLYNTGSILAKGGASTGSEGGSGSSIYLHAYDASIFNSGAINTSGGSSNTASGGNGGGIYLYGGNFYMGDIITGGSLLANGGAGVTSGGSGGYIELDNNGGKLWSNATISNKGGSATAGPGGNGNELYLYSDHGYDYGYDNYVETKGIKLSGAIDLSGGNGATGGGYGGTLSFGNDASTSGLLPSPAVEMVGFASFTMDGGSGVNGGNGGGYEIYTAAYWIGGDYDEMPAGSIVNQIPVSAKGGAGSLTAGGAGGTGGSINFDWEDYGYGVYSTITTNNSGAIDISGGAGDIGGDAGSVFMYGYGKLTNSGAITARGGIGTTTGGQGSPISDSIDFYSSHDIENTGAIDVTGGGTGITGGNGGGVFMYAGGQTRNSATIIAAGGAGTTNGGDGGQIDLFSEMTPTSNSGSLSVLKGTGGTSAIDGWIWIDWVDVGPIHDDTISI